MGSELKADEEDREECQGRNSRCLRHGHVEGSRWRAVVSPAEEESGNASENDAQDLM
jgi:hypothetical protein